jgi:hypothetical protein
MCTPQALTTAGLFEIEEMYCTFALPNRTDKGSKVSLLSVVKGEFLISQSCLLLLHPVEHNAHYRTS